MQSICYGIYGELLSGDKTQTGYLYNGAYGVHTDNNGLYYMRARYYNADISRFINQDILTGTPTASQSLNRYAYCQGNPINQNDPFGLCPQEMTTRDWIHLGLSIAGCIPYVGILANIANAVLYFREGDVLNGVLSMAGAAVGVGGIMSAVSGVGKVYCAIRTAGVALKTTGIAYTTGTTAIQTIEGAVQTYLLLEANNFELNKEVLMSAGQTVLSGAATLTGFKAIGSCIDEMAYFSAKGLACFTADTKVLTSEGYKNIEDIEVGDYVYSTDEETGESGYKEVLQVFVKETEVITHVYYETENEDQTETHEIETTLNHLFYVEGDWKAAGTLEAGDLLSLADGTQVAVSDITYEDRHTVVYNMEVADYHTYYVGEQRVWVHNNGCGSVGGSKSTEDSVLDDGLGTYASQGGHHPMAKKAFESVEGYNSNSALTISNSKLSEFGVRHSSITGQQNSLYSAYAKTGKPLTIEAMREIEISAMTNAGVPLNYATNAVDKAISQLAKSGISQPIRIPWN